MKVEEKILLLLLKSPLRMIGTIFDREKHSRGLRNYFDVRGELSFQKHKEIKEIRQNDD